MTEKSEPKKPGFWSVVASTLAAAFGVQSNKNRERDFKHGSFRTFIVAGLIFTMVFIFSVITVVNLVLNNAAK